MVLHASEDAIRACRAVVRWGAIFFSLQGHMVVMARGAVGSGELRKDVMEDTIRGEVSGSRSIHTESPLNPGSNVSHFS